MDGLRQYIQDQADNFTLSHLKQSDINLALKKSAIKNCHPIILQFSLEKFGLKRTNLSEFLKFVDGHVGARFITPTHVFNLDRTHVFIASNDAAEQNIMLRIDHLPFTVNLFGKILSINEVDVIELTFLNEPLQICSNKIKLPLTIRNWQHGDRMTPLGMSGSKMISDILIDKKIPQTQKEKMLVILDADHEIIGVPGLVLGEKFKVDNNSTKLIQVSISTPTN
jgi:tRNA(Ile)-lysidine synthase